VGEESSVWIQIYLSSPNDSRRWLYILWHAFIHKQDEYQDVRTEERTRIWREGEVITVDDEGMLREDVGYGCPSI